MTEAPKCPVCGEVFDNEAGKGGHLAVSKDNDHLAYRTLGTLPSSKVPEGSKEGSPKVLGEGLSKVEVEGLNLRSEPKVEASPSKVAGNASQREEKPTLEPQLVTLDLPKLLQPLLPEPSPTSSIPLVEPSTQGPAQRPKVDVPLAPFLSGTTALMVNTFYLRGEGDEKLTKDEVELCGFSRAAEGCLKFYFPEVSWDHPAVALVASGVALATIIQAKKAKPKKNTEAKEEPDEPPTPHSPDPPKVKSSGTGDAYWDSILAQAGGPAGGVSDD